jgi:hypothetical protein
MIFKNLNFISPYLSQLLSFQEAGRFHKKNKKQSGKSLPKKKELRRENKQECLMIPP